MKSLNLSNISKEGEGIISQRDFEALVKGGNFFVYDISGLVKLSVDISKKIKEDPSKKEILMKAHNEFTLGLEKKVVLMEETGEPKFFYLEKAYPGGNLSDKEKELLMKISEELNKDGVVDEEEIEEFEESSEDTKSLIESLRDKGYIEVEENDGEYDIVGLTEQGSQFLTTLEDDEEGDEEEEDEEESIDDNGEETNDGGGDNNEEENNNQLNNTGEGEEEEEEEQNNGDLGDNNEETNNEEESDEENNNGEIDEEEDNDGEVNNGDSPKELSDEEIQSFAKTTSTEDLQAFIAKSDDEKLKGVAQEELNRRAQSSQNNGNEEPNNEGVNNEEKPNLGNGEEEKNLIQNKEEEVDPLDFNHPEKGKENKEKFYNWIDEYLSDHDIDDLKQVVIKLILSSPKETKILKEHYRNEYQKTNGGNTISNVDVKEFKQWLNDYLDYKPIPHLKNYAVDLISKNPDSLNEMKGKYKNGLSIE